MTIADRLFLLVLATVPVQLNKFFFTQSSFVLGIPIDYLAPAIYLSDLAIIAYVAAFAIGYRAKFTEIYRKRRKFIWILLAFTLYLTISSIGQGTSAFWASLKFLEMSLMAIFASITLEKASLKRPLRLILAISLFWQSVLIIGQFALQRSLGLWILGERSFDDATFGIAHAQILGSQLLRPYGTFPHPNVAAAFLVIFMILFLSFRPQSKQKPLQIIVTVLSVVAIFLTFSQAALLVLAIIAIVLAQPLRIRLVISLLLIVLLGIFAKQILAGQIASIAERLTLAQAAFDITAKNPLFGVGSNNFIPQLSKLNLFSLAETRLLQPVHNIFLLILAENGLIGLLLFTALLATVAANITGKTKIALFAALLVFGSLDHFFWTLHQGQLLFWLSTGYILSKQK